MLDAALLVRALCLDGRRTGARLKTRGIAALERAAFRAHARSPAYARRCADLRDALATRFLPGRAYVSFSGGKDSAVIAHAVHAVAPQTPILRADAGMPYDWTLGDRTAWHAYARLHAWDYHEFPWDKRAAIDRGVGVAHLAAHATMFTALAAWASQRGLHQRVVGIRASESKTRKMLLGKRGCAYALADGDEVLAPIAFWRDEDVWAYVVTHDLPVLDVYAAFGADARSGMIGTNALAYGRIARLRETFPEIYLEARSEIDYALQLS